MVEGVRHVRASINKNNPQDEKCRRRNVRGHKRRATVSIVPWWRCPAAPSSASPGDITVMVVTLEKSLNISFAAATE
jgi:hypothetical protein